MIGIGSLILWVANERGLRKGSEDAGGCQAVNAHSTELSTLKRGSTRAGAMPAARKTLTEAGGLMVNLATLFDDLTDG